MSETKKINLSAMTAKTNNSTEKNTQQENIPEENSHKPSGVKINLSSIKSQIREKPIIKTPEVKNEPKDERTLYMESLTSKMTENSDEKESPKKENETNPPKKLSIKKLTPQKQKINTPEEEKNTEKEIKKLQISALKKPIEQSNNSVIKIDETKVKKAKISELKKPLDSCDIAQKEEFLLEKLAHDNKNPKANPNEVFHNYESEFKKKQGHILESIDKIKEIANIKKLSKINKIFITSIIGLTVIWIGFLFHTNPESLSLDNYKASILTLAGKQMTTQEVKEHQGNIENEIAWKLEENNLWGYNLGFEILVNEQWDAVYKFDWEEYETKELLDVAIYGKLEELKKDRIRDYFKNHSNETSQDSFEEDSQEDTSNIFFLEETQDSQENNTSTQSKSDKEMQSPEGSLPKENSDEAIENQDLQENQSENSSMDILMKNYWENNSTENVNDENSTLEEPLQTENNEEENIVNQENQDQNNDENQFNEMEIYEEFMFEEF